MVIVGCHKDRPAIAGDLLEEVQDPARGLRVEVTGRLIRQDEVRIVEQSPRYRHPLLLTTRKFVRHFEPFGPEPDPIQNFLFPLSHGGLLLPSSGPHDKTQVRTNGTIGQKLEILEYDPQPPSEVGDLFLFKTRQIISYDLAFSFFQGKFSVKGLQKAALTTTGLSDQIDELPFFQLEVHIAQDQIIPLKNAGILKMNDMWVLSFQTLPNLENIPIPGTNEGKCGGNNFHTAALKTQRGITYIAFLLFYF